MSYVRRSERSSSEPWSTPWDGGFPNLLVALMTFTTRNAEERADTPLCFGGTATLVSSPRRRLVFCHTTTQAPPIWARTLLRIHGEEFICRVGLAVNLRAVCGTTALGGRTCLEPRQVMLGIVLISNVNSHTRDPSFS